MNNTGTKSNGAQKLFPLPQAVVNLNGKWRFITGADVAEETVSRASPAYDDSAWQEVEVPHTWNVMPEYRQYDGVAWYRRTFVPPSGLENTHMRLRFDAVFYLAHIWLNGTYLGKHEGGYTQFEFDVSHLVKQGEENLVVVRVDNLRTTDRLPAHLWEGRSFGWHNDGGIVRDVSLLITSRAYITGQRVVAYPNLTGVDQADTASVTVSVSIRNTSNGTINGSLITDIVEAATGKSILPVPLIIPVSVERTQTVKVPLGTIIPQPKLWHFDHPHLYTWSTRLLAEGSEELHSLDTTFGIRLVELREARLYLNGEPVRLVGVSRHADTLEQGLAETALVMAADYNDLKRLNMVFSRPVHYPQHEVILDYCDRNGILLIPELPAWQLTAGQMADSHMRLLARQQLAEMVDAAANHPCVWAWSVGNELESDTVAGRSYVRDMVGYVKSLDPMRPVGFASYHLLVGRPWADATAFADFVMMNQYFGTWHGPKDSLGVALDAIHDTWLNKTVIVSEFGFMPHWEKIEGPAKIDPEKYYYLPPDIAEDSAEADELRQRVLRDQMAVFRNKPFVAGAIFWTYRGMMGVVDDHGKPRGSWSALRREFSPLLVDAFSVSSETCTASIRLRARGPLESDLPAYILRGYRLDWALTSPSGTVTYANGSINLPVLNPGETWDGEITWEKPVGDPVIQISILRPTGFSVIDQWYDPQGQIMDEL